ncbi:MAG: acyl-CoA dehydratase activase [Phycisphaerae bacterium]|nr:acyl-CoA dehydratase activase [Phycisphaerae bacterium]
MTRINGKKHVQPNAPDHIQMDLPDNGPLHLGIDIGSVSCKIALMDNHKKRIFSDYQRTQGRPMEVARDVLARLFEIVPADRIATMVATGNASRKLCEILEIDFINELICQSAAISYLRPEVRTLIEMGGQDSKVIFLDESGQTIDSTSTQADSDDDNDMADFTMNTNCAAGTGSFLDQQASRLNVDIETEFGDLALQSENPPRVAGRCSVFAKSDMIHLQQQATPVYDIVAGLCLGLARNLKSTLCQGKDVTKPIAFCGGVASNAGVIQALENIFDLSRGELIVPEEHAITGAIGAVLAQMRQGAGTGSLQEPRVLLAKLDEYIHSSQVIGHRLKPLSSPSNPAPESAVHSEIIENARASGQKIRAFLGIDVGSISTNVVVMDDQKRVLSKAYLMTASRPLEAVRNGLAMVDEVKDVVEICGVATTGSGRYLTGDFVGADLVINEITAQATGAAIVDPTVDTIFEIGGQDSKYISLEDGVVVDFEMNHACAAGTGSFLEEQAERLGMSIKKEFAAEAFKSDAPIRLGERCTVFMESDLLSYQQQGAERPDLTAGLCYSIVTNYINRVVGHRKIGQRVFFQGGTAFNRGVVSAFEAVTGKRIQVPDHHEVTGALGAAELARRHMTQLAQEVGQPVKSTFRGFDLSQLEYKIRSFVCEHCSTNCEIKEVTIKGGESLYYGSRCDRYNIKKDTKQDKDIPNLFAQRQKMLEEYGRCDAKHVNERHEKAASGPERRTVGIPLALSNYQLLPLWGTFFDELGFEVVHSGRSTKSVIQEGVEAVLSQPCFPVKVAHGHVLELVKKEVDFIWLPSIVSMGANYKENKHNHLCPYVQTIPYQVRVALQARGIDFTGEKNHILDTHIRFQEGLKGLRKTLYPLMAHLKVSKGQIHRAIDVGLAAQRAFEQACRDRGKEVLASLTPGQKACVIVSRPYNGCDSGISLDMPRKLRKLNILPIPIDFLDLSEANVIEPELQVGMYWKYGQNILRAAHIIRDDPRLNAIYISNFSCGPDSFIITLFKELLIRTAPDGTEYRKPSLVIEIDEHSADAGVITRLEAYLESLKAVEGHQDENPIDYSELAQQPANSPWSREWGDCSGRKIYIPWMGDPSYAVAAAFRHCGQEAEVMPIADDETFRWGRKYTTGKECLPCIITTGDMLKKLAEKDADPEKIAFFMPGSSGPCRFGQYNCTQRLVIKQMGLPNTVPVVSPNQDSNFYEGFRRFKKDPTRLAFNGIAAMDLCLKVLHKIRPYEVEPGSADRVYQKSLRRIEKAIEQGVSEKTLIGLMGELAEDFNHVEIDKSTPRPIVTVVGEMYVRSHRIANNNVILQLEQLGAEVALAGFDEWLYYTNLTRRQMSLRGRNASQFLQNYIKNYAQHRIEDKLARPLERYFGTLAEGDINEVIDCAKPYMHESFEGEAILSIGKIVESAHHGSAGVVNVMPFTCMPSTVVGAVSRQLSIDLGGLPIANISYDGQQDPTLQTRLEAFLHQVKNFDQRKPTVKVHVN